MLAALADVECRYSSARRRLSSSSVEPLRRESKIIGRFTRGEGEQACAEVENARGGKSRGARGRLRERRRKEGKRASKE